ncbi:hypothetical protein MMC12_001068 [Toensbergia leucococca]|nr:hypothetical protein [Toensbergia leucococca]
MPPKTPLSHLTLLLTRPLRPLPLPLPLHHHRTLTQNPQPRYPRKDSQHKDSMNVEANEYSKSGTDDQAARQEEAAFDPQTTDPQAQKEVAGEGGGDEGNPLDVSPANPDVSQQRGGTEGGAENSSASSGTKSDRQRTSGGGSPKKGKQVS